MVNIYCVNTGTTKAFPEGTTLLEMLSVFEFERPYPILSAKVNNVSQGLKYRAFNNRKVEFVDYRNYSGRRVYSRSLCFLLCKAVKDIFPNYEIILRRPISKGYYCTFKITDNQSNVSGKPNAASGSDIRLTSADLEAIKARMEQLVEANLPFKRYEVPTEEAIALFTKLGYNDKVRLLETVNDIYVKYYTLDGTPDYYYNTLLSSTGYLKVWDLSLYKEGLLLRLPDRHNPNSLAPFIEQPKTFEVLSEHLKWNNIMGLDNVGDVNFSCLNGGARDLIEIAEALQEKKIVQIAEEIDCRATRKENPVRLVLITGPSSSGKSTFCKRLSVQLKACGLKPVSFSTDDYFVNRLDTPRLPDGSFDFDNFDTVDHAYLQRDIIKLLDGESVEIPEFNFVTGLREFNGKRLKLEPGMVLLVEGIHALNPRLTDMVDEDLKYKIFVNTITSISLDNHNCIPTSDNRLLRRIVRDYNKGAFTARESILNWPNVRRAEVKWIYPYQENANVLFNSTYIVEFAVLRPYAERILMTVPKNCPEYSEAYRLLRFLSYFVPVSAKDIPATSLIRSFIG